MGQDPPPAGWMESQLAKGRCLLLLDGLDEVADAAQRGHLAEWVQQQIRAYGNNRFLLTSRPFGYRSNPLSGVMVLEMQPFTSQQIRRFIHNWYQATERMSSQRVDLYEEICEVFLGKRQEARGVSLELNARQKRQVLQPLAYEMMLQGKPEISTEEAGEIIKAPLEAVSPSMTPLRFLQMVEETSGLLLERERGIYSFAHLTFQEYLAATHITKEAGLEDDLIRVVEQSWWHETIRLYCAQTDAIMIIAACLVAQERQSIPALTLALECAQEAPKIQHVVRIQLDTIIQQGREDPDLQRWRLIAEVLLKRRQRQMVPLSETTYRDTSLVTCAEYQIFLDEQRARGMAYHPDHWQTSSFPPGMGSAPVLGKRSSDATAFCQWLNENVRETGTWFYRLSHQNEWEQAGADKTMEASQPAGIGYWTSNGETFTWLTRPPISVRETIHSHFTSDRLSVSYSTLVVLLDRALALALDLALVLDPDLADHFTQGFVRRAEGDPEMAGGREQAT